jgi:hypothetical protein
MTTKDETLPLVITSDFAERLARSALRGFFGDHEGFKDMNVNTNRRAAIRAVQRVLDEASRDDD